MAFDPKKYLINLKGKEYLPVSARLIWFRQEHPDWSIITTPIEINMEKNFAIFSASIMNPEGKIIATGTKMETIKDFGDFLEKAECVPTSTQILTAQGWKKYDQLRVGEMVAAYDAESDRLAWSPLLAVRVYEDAPVVRLFNGKGFDVVCTPEHKWPVQYGTVCKGKAYRYRRFRETQELKTGDVLTVAATGLEAVPDAPILSVTPEQAFVMGMLITDGCMRYSGKQLSGYISQSKPHVVSVIREHLAGVPHREDVVDAHTRTFPTGKTYDCRQGYRWHLAASYLHRLHDDFHISHETGLSDVVAYLPSEARAALLEAMTLAEGDKRGTFAQMPGRNDWVIDLWTQLCALEGSMVCKSKTRRDAGGIWIARRKKPRFVYASNLVTEDAGRMQVWCPQTQYGTWVARFDNDVTTITGNTGSVGRALAMCGFGTQFAPEFAEGSRLADAPMGPSARFAPRPNGAPNGNGNFNNRPGPMRPNGPMNGNGNGANEPRPPMPMSPVEDERPFDNAAMAAPALRERPVEQRPSPPSPRPQNDAPPRSAANGGVVRERVPEPDYTDPGGDDEPDSPDELFADEFAAPRDAAPRPSAPVSMPPVQLGSDKPNPLANNPVCSSPNCTMKLTPGQMTLSMQKFGKPLCVLHQKEAVPGGADRMANAL